MLVRVADYQTYARKGGDFFGSALCVAAGDHDPGLGIFPMNAANGGAGVLVGGGGYGAGVEDSDSGIGRLVGALQSALLKLTLDGRAVRLGGAASEILHVESSHASILA